MTQRFYQSLFVFFAVCCLAYYFWSERSETTNKLLETAHKSDVSRFSGSFEPLFDSNLRRLYASVDIAPTNLDRKSVKIIPKSDDTWFVDSLLAASYSYQGPTHPVQGNSQLVRVEVLVRDSPQANGLQIKSVNFNDQNIPLQPRDIYGNRGTGSFQVPPGKYKLHWIVQRDKLNWPRELTREEEVTIDSRDLWLQIEIVGDEASIR